jgi:hypothetical protein
VLILDSEEPPVCPKHRVFKKRQRRTHAWVCDYCSNKSLDFAAETRRHIRTAAEQRAVDADWSRFAEPGYYSRA